MSLLPWRGVTPGVNGVADEGLQGGERVPEIPTDDRSGAPLGYLAGWRPARTDYARRHQVPTTGPVSRGIAAAVHARVDRIGQARDWLGRWLDRTQGRAARPVRTLGEPSGEALAQWVVKNILNARKRPVPSFGFGLAPVLAHSVAARRQRWLRCTLLVSMLAWLGASHLRGLAAVVVAMLLCQFLCGRRGRAFSRWWFRSPLSLVLLAAAAYGVWVLALPYLPVLYAAAKEGFRLVLHSLTVSTAVYLLDRWVCHAYTQSLRPGREHIGIRPRLAPFAAKKADECAITETWQSIGYSRAQKRDRFIGAGVDAWARGATRIQLTSARTGHENEEPEVGAPGLEAYRKFEADELLDKVQDALEKLSGSLTETHALPNCDVSEFLGVPQGRWKKLTRTLDSGGTSTEWPEAREMCVEARGAPTGHFSRRYLAAQVTSWDGQIVVTVFAHAALEGNTLHFVTRPHVLAPLLPSANAVPARSWRLVRELAETPLQAGGDTVELMVRLYRTLGRGLGLLSAVSGAAATVPYKDDGLPVSLREHCARARTEDMHQNEDIQRYVSILQSRMFSTVGAFLADHGLATGDFQRQAVAITQNFINGDNNQVNTGSVGEGMHQQGNSAGPADRSDKAG